MTLKEINELTMEAYRRGYNDAMADRAARPAATVAPTYAPHPSPVDQPVPESIEAFNLAVANMLSFDGSHQEPVTETLKRTRG